MVAQKAREAGCLLPKATTCFIAKEEGEHAHK
jgi:hypothetical protein